MATDTGESNAQIIMQFYGKSIEYKRKGDLKSLSTVSGLKCSNEAQMSFLIHYGIKVCEIYIDY